MNHGGNEGVTRWCKAVVIGGSVAGLLAARVLADRFEHVTILERDELRDEPAIRRGTPQASHVHALLLGGRRVLEDLHQGIVDDLVRQGAPLVSLTADVKSFRPDGWFPRFDSELSLLLASRQLLEWILRARTLEHPRIELVSRMTVGGLILEDGCRRVRGVSARLDKDPQAFEADLVVDASGRGSTTPQWLAKNGFESPKDTLVDAYWGYASRFLQMPPGWDPGFAMMGSIPPSSGSGLTRGCVLAKQDGEDRWILSLMGCAKDYPPGDEEGFAQFAESLPFPDIAEALAAAKPLTSISTWRNMVNRYRHYENLQSFPERLIVIGDAVAAFNPVHGQGMSVAAVSAALLGNLLDLHAADRGDLDGFALGFQRRLAEEVKFPWSISTGGDYNIPGVDGPPIPTAQKEQAEIFKRIMMRGHDDTATRIKLIETLQLLRSPDWLSEPELLEQLA
jgi:2-polyprenyl-6-methoxyphenol hydroxylase-like FAD-dependent oxidoreductase